MFGIQQKTLVVLGALTVVVGGGALLRQVGGPLDLAGSAVGYSGYIQARQSTAVCMHKKNSDSNNGNPIHLWSCSGGTTNEMWYYDHYSGYLHLVSNPDKCIHKANDNYTNGNPIHLWSCSDGPAQNKSWDYDATTGYIKARYNPSACIQLKNSNFSNGNPIHLWSCAVGPANNKTWTIQATYNASDPVELATHHLTGVDGAWHPTDLSAALLSGGRIFSQAVSANGASPGVARLDLAAGNIKYHASDATAHDGEEAIDVIALLGNPLSLNIDGEAGSFTKAMNTQGTTHTLTFSRSYSQPVLFVQVVTNNGASPISVYATQVTGSGATVKFYENSTADGVHNSETIHWAVIDAGTYDLDDGRRLVVGTKSLATGSVNDYETVSLTGRFIGNVAVVAGIQSLSANLAINTENLYAGVRLTKRRGIDGTVVGLDLRLMRDEKREDGVVVTSVGLLMNGFPQSTGTVGYMALGTAWEQGEGRLQLMAADGSKAGIEFARHPNGLCYNLSDEDFDNRATSLGFAASDARTTVVVYEDAYCTGGALTVSATAGANSLSLSPMAPSSLRVLWTKEQRLTTVGCQPRGTVLLQNALGWLIFDETGDLVLYRHIPADGTLIKAWASNTAGLDATAVCFQADGNLVLYNDNGVARWAPNVHNQGVTRLTLQNNCNLALQTDAGVTKWSTNTYDCWNDIEGASPTGMPNATISFADLDGDGDEEMALLLLNQDGTGTFIVDPMGIADLSRTLGYAVNDDFVEALSVTQQSILLSQLDQLDVQPGDSASGAEVQAGLDRLDDDQDRKYTAYHISGSSGLGYSASTGVFETSVTFGSMHYIVDEDTVAFEDHAVQFSASAGQYYTVESTLFSISAEVSVENDGFVVGAEFSVVSASYTVGEENGTHYGVSANAGAGLWFEARVGKNDQYGFTVALPNIPVGVSIYIKGSDAVWVYEQATGWTVDTALTVAELSTELWGLASDLAVDTYKDISIALENTAEDTAYALQRAAGEVVVVAAAIGDVYVAAFDAAAVAITDAIDAVGDGLEDGFETVTETVSTWAEEAANTVDNLVDTTVDGITDVAEDTVDLIGDAVKEVGNVLKFW